MSLPKQLTMAAWNAALAGCGAELELHFLATQETKAGQRHKTNLVLKLDRYEVRRLMEQVAEMQTRDRARIDGELARLKREIEPLVRT